MKQILRLVIVAWIPMVLVNSSGCGGGLTQQDMMRHAIRRAPADDEETSEASVAGQKPPSNETASPTASSVQPVAVGPVAMIANANATIDPPASSPQMIDSDIYREPEQAARDASKTLSPEASRRQAIAKMQRIGEALEAYCQDKGHYPARAIYGTRKEALLSWRVALLPYLGHAPLYQQFQQREPWDSKHNKALLALIPPVFVSPGGVIGQTNFLLPVGAGAAFAGRSAPVPRYIEDGATNTVILVESDNDRAVPWTAPEDYQVNLRAPTAGVGTLRPGGFLVVWGGGTVNWIDITTPQHLLQTIYTTDSGDGVTASQVGHDPNAYFTPVDPNTPLADESLATTTVDETKTEAAPNRTSSTQNGHALMNSIELDSSSPTVAHRHPVPGDDALKESKKLLRELYHEEYKAAATQQARQALVRQMLDQLDGLDADIMGQYALLETVRQICVQSGAVETALKAVDELSTRFDIDSHATKLDTLVGLSRSAIGKQATTIVQASLGACDEAFLAEHYDVADQLCGIALAASQKLRDTSRTIELQRLRRELQESARSHRLAERAIRTLDDNPNDQRASTLLGQYLCFVRQDWTNGLPILARGDDPRLATLANRELVQPSQAAEQVKLGDAWWRVAEKANSVERRSMILRAVHWYRLAMPNLPPGLERVKIERRLQQVA